MRNYCYLLMLQLSCAAMIGGCGLARNQTVATHTFGDATAALGMLSEQEFLGIRAGIMDMNAALLALDQTKNTVNLKLDDPTTLAATSKRVAAARTLRNYGELLLALAGTDSVDGLRRSARSLVDSADKSLGGDWSEEQRSAVQELATAAGSYFLEKKKAKALRRIVPAYEKPVDSLAALLERDFVMDTGGFLDAYENVARRLKNAALRVINSGGKYSLSERETAVRAWRMAETALDRVEGLNGRFSAAVNALRKANRELVEAIAKRDYSRDEIRKYARQLRELADAYQLLAQDK